MDHQSQQQWNSVPESVSETWADTPEMTTEAWSDHQYLEASTELPVYSDNVEMNTETQYDQALYQDNVVRDPVYQENVAQEPVYDQQLQPEQNYYSQEDNQYQEPYQDPHNQQQQEDGQESSESFLWFQSPADMVNMTKHKRRREA